MGYSSTYNRHVHSYIRTFRMKAWLTALLTAAMAALAPIQAVMVTVGILIFADAATGMYAAHKRGEPMSSAAMRRTVSKMLIYQGVVICGFLLEANLLDHLIPVAKIVAGAIGMVEFKSILENANGIMGMDIFKTVIAKLGSNNDVVAQAKAELEKAKDEPKKE